MCEHCGCRGVPSIGELMDEHYAILDDSALLRQALAAGEQDTALRHLERLTAHLATHVRKEEIGIFTAMREQGDFVEEVDRLEGEHRDLDAAIAALDPASAGFADDVRRLLAELAEHVERENLGIFPVAVVSLGRSGWDLVSQAQAELPTFVPESGGEPRATTQG